MNKEKMAEKLILAWRLLNVPAEMGIFGEENVFTNAQDAISDALLILTEENANDFQVSETFCILHSQRLDPKEGAKVLFSHEWHPVRPIFFGEEQINEMKKVNGGYSYMDEKQVLESIKAMVQTKDETNRNLKTILDARDEEINSLKRELRTCVNELCLKCGDYKGEYLGACNGCRWKETKDRLCEME